MGKLEKIEDWRDALKIKLIEGIDIDRFSIPVTEEILKDNGWVEAYDSNKNFGFCPPEEDYVFDEEKNDWVVSDNDFSECFVWYRAAKDAWCYRFNFGTYVYDIKSIGELEIILAREGFVYHFNLFSNYHEKKDE